jgi:hypothetical protein
MTIDHGSNQKIASLKKLNALHCFNLLMTMKS